MKDDPKKEAQTSPRRTLAPETARKLGSASTDAKRRAARENGKLGGWRKGQPRSEETRRKISATKTLSMLRRVFKDTDEQN